MPCQIVAYFSLLLTSFCYYWFILCARQFFFGLRCGSRRTHIAPSHRTKRRPSTSGSARSIQNYRVAQRRVMRACHVSLKSSANQCAGRSRHYQLLQVISFFCGYCQSNSGYIRSESLVVIRLNLLLQVLREPERRQIKTQLLHHFNCSCGYCWINCNYTSS